MKNLIRKILKEETGEFDWAKSVDPLDEFGDYFYGRGKYEHKSYSAPGMYIKRNNNWWRDWIEETYHAHLNLLEDTEELLEMVKNLSNPRVTGYHEYYKLANEVQEYVSPSRALNGRSIFDDAATTILQAYRYFDDYAVKNNLTILEVLDVFSNWLDKMKKEGKPLHGEDGTAIIQGSDE